ncbi:MAG TPA: hypothetical protein VN735_02810, partial [Steroidobacteraceae bacterium]|nr:hypothetical protein [Steroidobacteraceae bacterium]
MRGASRRALPKGVARFPQPRFARRFPQAWCASGAPRRFPRYLPSVPQSDLLPRLQSALGDAYRIDRELPGGGMSRLFLGTERSLNRQVVIKVLPPEMTSEVSATRFK